VEAQLEERFLLVDVKLAEDLSRIEEVSVVNDLLDVPAKERQVEDKRHPVSIDKEEECQETVYGSLWDDVGVESVAEVNRVNVVTFQVTVHNSEKDLQEEVDGVDKHRQQEQPSFSRHHLGLKCARTTLTLQVGGRVKLGMTMLVEDKDS
jgi:hypothetical protein